MSASPAMHHSTPSYGALTQMYVTMRVGGQLFGVPVKHVRDVLKRQPITPIPLALPEVAGSLNLRGRIVTVIDVRKRLQLEEAKDPTLSMFVVVEHKNELYSLMVDAVSEVITVEVDNMEQIPANIHGAWKEIATGIFRLEKELLMIVEPQELLQFSPPPPV